MHFVAQTRKHWKTVRILADDSGLIEPLFEANKLEADSVRMILRVINDFKRKWCDLTGVNGKIKTLDIQQIEFFPLQRDLR